MKLDLRMSLQSKNSNCEMIHPQTILDELWSREDAGVSGWCSHTDETFIFSLSDMKSVKTFPVSDQLGSPKLWMDVDFRVVLFPGHFPTS